MSKDKDEKYNLRKKSKKKYKKQNDTDSDESDSDWSPDCDDDEMDLLEYQKFIQKLFPSKSGTERVNKLEKIDKLVKKSKKKKKKKKSKKSSSEEDEYDEEYDEEVEELKNALGENAKFNIIFTIGDPNGEYNEFDEWEEEEDVHAKNTIISSKDGSDKETSQEETSPEDRLFEVKQRVWVKTPKMKIKKAGTVKKCYKKKNNYDVKCDVDSFGLFKDIKSKYIEKIDSEEEDLMNSLVEMKELLKLKRSKGSDAVMEKLEEYTKTLETKKKDKKEKEEEKTKHNNVFKLRKLLSNKNYINEFKFFRAMSVEEQHKILDEVKKINEYTDIDKPHRISLLESDIPIPFKAHALKKINILKHMNPETGEYFKIKHWVDNFMRVPFGKIKKLPIKFTDGAEIINSFMENAKQTLDDCVYGLEDAKMQILQFIGQWISNPDALGNSIAIKGPPGTGKTTLIKEGISKILKRPFAFLALGGATDSSFLEGHSYTYEGSQWGKIIDILINSKCMNPVIYFDELDKISNTPKGEEITGILTHLTDNAQNTQFHDKYFSSVDFDLSKVLFIFSYNDESKVNPILKDRMYRIHTDGYKNQQKLIIAKKYLIPNIEKSVNFEKEQIIIPDEILNHIIDTFTEDEKGVRNLKRCLEIIFTKLNLYRLMKPDSKLFDDNEVLKVKFPYTVKQEDLNKLIKKGEQTGVPFGMYM